MRAGRVLLLALVLFTACCGGDEVDAALADDEPTSLWDLASTLDLPDDVRLMGTDTMAERVFEARSDENETVLTLMFATSGSVWTSNVDSDFATSIESMMIDANFNVRSSEVCDESSFGYRYVGEFESEVDGYRAAVYVGTAAPPGAILIQIPGRDWPFDEAAECEEASDSG